MTKEQSRSHEYFWPLASLGILAIATFSAFSRKTRAEIWQRDGGVSAESGESGQLEAAHYDHTRNETYDTVDNGRMLTKREHYLDHVNRHGHNGLSVEGNKWALAKIWERLSDSERAGLPPPETIE